MRRRSPGDRFGTSEDRSSSSSLFVGNIPNYFREGEVREFFEKFGKVNKVSIGMNKKGMAYSFVQYAERKDAETAYDTVNKGPAVDGFKLRVDWDVGFREGRQYGRGKSGGQVRDEYRYLISEITKSTPN